MLMLMFDIFIIWIMAFRMGMGMIVFRVAMPVGV
jgi:hypothetical protein